VPKVSQSVPKGLQKGAPGARFDYFFCKKPTLHSTAYLLCFRCILGVLGSPVLKKFLVVMCVGSRSPNTAVNLSLFLIFMRKCVKMGDQTAGEISPKNRLFLIFFPLVPLWVPLAAFSLNLGLPGYHFATFLGALGIILAPLGPTKKMMPRQCKIQ